jgi:hypothetical protein
MTDHEEINQFFEEILNILIKITPQHADIENHVEELRKVIDAHKVVDKYAKELSGLNDNELEMIIRFVEKPHGRHHIAEVEKLWKEFGAETAGRLLIKHFYDHNKNHMVNADKLKHWR